MRNKKLMIVAGAILLVSLLISAVSVSAFPLQQVYSWTCNTTGWCALFQQNGTGDALMGRATASGSWSVYGFNSASTGQGVRGYASASDGYGVYGRNPYNIGVYGEGGTGSGDYGGYFTGFEGVRGAASGSNGYGTWGSAVGTSGIGAYGYANGTSGYGVYGYSYYYIGVRGYGGSDSGDYGGYFYGYEGARGIASGSNGYGTWGTASGTYGIGAYGSSTNYIGMYGVGDEFGGYFLGDTGVFGQGYSSYGRGVYGYSAASSGEGVRGYTSGYGGDGVMGYATSSYGFGVDSLATGYGGYGVRAQASGTSAWAGVFNSTNYHGIYANGASGRYDGYFPNCIYVGGTLYGSCSTFVGTAVIARNDGAEKLEAGDLVVFKGFDAFAADSGEPALSVAKAGGGNGAAVVGVVQGVYVIETFRVAEAAPAEEETRPTLVEPEVAEKELAPEKDHSPLPPAKVRGDEEPAAEVPNLKVEKIVSPEPVEEGLVKVKPTDLREAPPDEPGESNVMVEAAAGRFAEGSVEPGQYAIVMLQGFVPVKVDAVQPIRAGDWVVALPEGGVAAVSGDMYAMALSQGAVSVGRALEPLESGSGTIYVYVNFR